MTPLHLGSKQALYEFLKRFPNEGLARKHLEKNAERETGLRKALAKQLTSGSEKLAVTTH
ncbi:MAG: hypothetical protein FWD46_01530 [Cystobacterineae bacterium]|nr:hypothetical protein [Cystobacterineae bacterium]